MRQINGSNFYYKKLLCLSRSGNIEREIVKYNIKLKNFQNVNKRRPQGN